MITLRNSEERGHADHGWLKSLHTFSFADYYDRAHMGFRSLRVINEDRVSPSGGFPTHAHQDMEILSYVLEGELEHKDSLGTGSVIRPGDVQRMSAGRGVSHSEFNPSKENPVHFLQIWILPEKLAATPEYEQKHFTEGEKRNRLKLIAAPLATDGSITVHQDVIVLASVLEPSHCVVYDFKPGRFGWIQMTHGEIQANGTKLTAGDGAAISHEKTLKLQASHKAEFLLFDLA
jgi:quercetin 2,3-dioxygenase